MKNILVMQNSDENIRAAQALLGKAKEELADNMKARGIAVVIWDLASASMQYIPEIVVRDGADKSKAEVVRITGIYRYGDKLFLIEEDKAGVSVDRFYNRNTEVKPSVVTLTEDMAASALGDPEGKPGFTTAGTIEEWINVANCYFQALIEE